MLEAAIDPFPTAALTDRYSLGRTALYDRLKALEITPQREGNKTFVSKGDLERLDALHAHLEAKGKVADFLAQSPNPIQEESSANRDDRTEVNYSLEPSEQIEAAFVRQTPDLLPANGLQQVVQSVTSFVRQDIRENSPIVRKAIAVGRAVLSPLVRVQTRQAEALGNIQGSLEQLAANSQKEVLPPLWYVDRLLLVCKEELVINTSEVAQLLGLSPSALSGKKSFNRKGFKFIRTGREGRESGWMVQKIPASELTAQQ